MRRGSVLHDVPKSGERWPGTAPPARLGRYHLLAPIAFGGMAELHLAAVRGPQAFHKFVVVKTLKPVLAAEPEFRQMLLDEARLAARLNHPNIVHTYEVDEKDGFEFIAMEHLEGQSVARIAKQAMLEDVKLDPSFWVRIACDALAGLQYAHAFTDYDGRPLDVVHRDVSPQNLFVTYEGVTKVLDFGVAKAAFATVQTAAGMRKGKLAYMAPEQARGERVDRRADVYAMGVVLWELLARRRLLLGASVHETLQRVLDDTPLPRLSVVGWRDCPQLEQVIARALERDREKRWPTAAAMSEALEACLGGTGPGSRRGEVARVMGSLFEKHRDEERQTLSQRVLSLGAPEAAPRATVGPAPADGEATDPTLPLPPSAFVRSAPPPARRRRVVWVLAGVLVAGLAAGAALVLRPAWAGARAEALARSARAVTQPVAAATPQAPACPDGMAPVPGGSFYMGDDEGTGGERPAHKVTLAPFCVDQLEVTEGDYAACSARGECKRAFSSNEWPGITEREREAYDPLCNARSPVERASHPINCVDWDMARVYCAVQKKRLPTEAEWEFAARGPDGRRYPWGDEEPTAQLLNACGPECAAWGRKNRVALSALYTGADGWAGTAPVGSFPKGASRYGVKDLVGNVWEWVADWGGPYTRDDATEPRGPATGTLRVMRGGAWNSEHAAWVSPSFRFAAPPSMRSHGVGFRCAR